MFSDTNAGLVRKNNQDAYNIGEYSDNACWAVVCDGMGGANAGDVASRIATETISKRLSEAYRENMSTISVENLLITSIAAANLFVYDLSKENHTMEGMGTTVVAAVVIGDSVVIAHVGDSRAYILQNNELIRITKDHSYVQSLIDSGKISQDEAVYHPYKNIITRALGLEERVDIDCVVHDFTENSALLLCSDGLTNYVSEDEIKAVLLQSGEDDKTKQLITLANRNGGGDNITAVIIIR